MADDSVAFDLRRLLSETRVGDLTLAAAPVLSPDQSLDDAVDAMRDVRGGCVLVCAGRELLGIVTERDLLRFVAEGVDFGTSVLETMTTRPQTLSEDATLLDAVRLMDQGGYRRLPVMTSAHQLAGIIDVKTVMSFVVDQFPTTVYNQASQELLTAKRAEGA